LENAPSIEAAMLGFVEASADNLRNVSSLWFRDIMRFPAGAAAVQHWEETFGNALGRLIERGIREKVFRKVEPRLAAEALLVSVKRMIDPDLELVVAGSSHADMPTFGSWERTVLRHTAELVDHISLHAYYQELHGDTDSYLASGAALDRYIATTAAIIDETLAELGLDKKIGISVDEWNVWDLRRWNEVDQARLAADGSREHPRVIEDVYTVTDAVVVGSLLSSLLRNVDRVTMANQAQLVNVIAPIRTEPGGPAWRQTTFHPFRQVAAFASGESLRLTVEGERLRTAQHGEVDLVDVAATTCDAGRGAVFLTNRATASPTEVKLRLRGARYGLYAAETLTTPDGETRHAVNTAEAQPVRPVPLPGAAATSDPGGTTITVTLPPLSWTVLQLCPEAGPHA